MEVPEGAQTSKILATQNYSFILTHGLRPALWKRTGLFCEETLYDKEFIVLRNCNIVEV
jgi:hypothetical protein